MNDYRLYILMRNDLPSMGAGRAAAQESHAANAFIHEWGNTVHGGLGRGDVHDWEKQTKQGFGTAIVLSASKAQIDKIFKFGTIPSGWVVDPDYVVQVSVELAPYIKGVVKEVSPTDPTKLLIHRSEKTCAYIFGTKDQLAPLLGDLPLYS